MISTTADREIITERIFNASRAIVYQAWTNPDQLRRWWGPTGFTNTFHEFDLRSGGKWSFTMHGPDKGNYGNECEFLEVVYPSLLSWKRYTAPLFNVVVNFEEISKEQTKVVFKQVFDTVAESNKLRALVGEKNEEVFDRLKAELEK